MLVHMNDDDRVWRIGELAQISGLTVRTLHHYDQIGLLCPSLRTGGGHRLYAPQDATRLYEIVALRGLGLQLEQIRELLTTDVDPRALLGEQVRTLTVQLKAGARLRERLAALLAALDTADQPTASDLLGLVQQTVAVERLAAEYLSPEQMERLGHRRPEPGAPAAAPVKNELPRLYEQALAEYDAGTDPVDPVVRAIAEQIDEASAALSGGDDQVTGAVRRMWAERGEEVYPGTGIPWAALVEYLDRARHPNRAHEPDRCRTAPEDEQ
jgi:DNA-binding transcriptional MerR regulator